MRARGPDCRMSHGGVGAVVEMLVADLRHSQACPASFPDDVLNGMRGAGRIGDEVQSIRRPQLHVPITPCIGLDAVAYIFRGTRPARWPARPARTARFIAVAI